MILSEPQHAPETKAVYQLIYKAIQHACMHPKYYGRLTDQWVTDTTIVQAIKDIGIMKKLVSDFDTAKLNKGLTNHPKIAGTMIRFDGSNDCGIYRCNYVGRYFYYLTSPHNKTAKYPPVATEKSLWVDKRYSMPKPPYSGHQERKLLKLWLLHQQQPQHKLQQYLLLKMRKHHHHRHRNSKPTLRQQ
jgi:hypothetical protein